MNKENKICQNCKNQFTIEPEDFQFYERMKVPPPTWCPECRTKRRMSFRNERTLYRRKCDATGRDIISMIASGKPYKVYVQDYWKSDAWDPLEYGQPYDFSKPFFEQFNKLLVSIPHPNLVQKNVVNSDYSNFVLNLKNCYFTISNDTGEDNMYAMGRILRAKQCVDIHQSTDVEQCYELVDSSKSNMLRYSQNCEGCLDSVFLYDCRNCTNCVGCVGLRNKQYYIFNKPYSRDDYFKEFEKLNLGSYRGFTEARQQFEGLKLSTPRKYAAIIKSENVIGDDITESKNCYRCFWARNNVENCRYSFVTQGGTRDVIDADLSWNGAEILYETISVSAQRVLCSTIIWVGYDIQYSYNCFDSNNLFGCVGLRNKQYCILNKQYTKEEYESLVPKIIEHMNKQPYVDSLGRVYQYGEFFPPDLSPFAYNETIAQEYFPLTKEQAIAQGYRWKDPEKRSYEITVMSNELPDHIKDVDNSILKQVIRCAHNQECNEQCTQAFKIIPEELQFYQRMNLPLPRLCPNCRHYQRLKQRNPLRLWHRQCMCDYRVYPNTIKHPHHPEGRCPNEFETSYAPDRKEIVYCEQCYNAEVV